MKSCPLCKQEYSDVTLSFCMEDGTPLIVGQKQSTIDTIAFNAPIITSEKIVPDDDWNFTTPNREEFQNQNSHIWQSQNLPVKERVTQPNFTQPYIEPPVQSPRKPEYKAFVPNPQPKKMKTFHKVLLAILPAFLVAIGFGAYFFYAEESEPKKVENINFAPLKIEQKPNEEPKTAAQTVENNQSSDNSDVKKEVEEFIENWRKSAEAKNLVDFTGKYAAQIVYFEKEQASVNDVKNDFQQVLSNFDEIRITLSDIKIASTEDGKRATAVFDKKWLFEGKDKIEEGKTHTKLELEKVNENWKIVSEKNLRIYLAEK